MDWSFLSAGLLSTGTLALISWAAWTFLKKQRRIEMPAIHDSPSLARSFGKAISEMSFENAIHSEHAHSVVRDKLVDEINGAIGARTADGLVVGLEIVRSAEAKKLILATFSEATAKMIKDGSAVQVVTKSGEKLLVAVDANGRKFISQAKQVDPSLASKMSQVTTLVVGAAHLIAGYDNAKKLNAINEKVDRVLLRIDNHHTAKLKEIYETLRFDLVQEGDPSKLKSDLRGLQRDLRELRHIWIGEIHDDLKAIGDPKQRSWFSKKFSRNKTTANELRNKILSQQNSLGQIRFALWLEQMICEILGNGDTYSAITIPDVKNEIQKLAELVSERERWIKELLPDAAQNNLIVLYDRFQSSFEQGDIDGQKVSKKSRRRRVR